MWPVRGALRHAGRSKPAVLLSRIGRRGYVYSPTTTYIRYALQEWYDIKAPSMFNTRVAGKTPVTRTTGTKVASDSLKGRVFTLSLADLHAQEDLDYRKIKLVGEEVQGKTLLTNFYGMDMTRDKLCSLIRKWQTLIEAHADVKTTDGYTLRLFAIAFTTRRKNQIRKTSYAQSAQVRAIRKKMVEIMTAEASKSDLKTLVKNFVAEGIAKEIEKKCAGIYPLQVRCLRRCDGVLVSFVQLSCHAGHGACPLTYVAPPPLGSVILFAERLCPQGEDHQGPPL